MIWYVYIIFRLDGSPCYVGKGKGRRFANLSRGHRGRNFHLLNIIAQAAREGFELPIVKLRSNMDEASAFELERAFIAAIGRYPNGPLVNMTDGGEGISGYTHNEETKAKIGAKNRGRQHSSDARAKISAFQKGRPKSAQHAAKISIGQTGMIFSAERRAAISRAMAGKKRAPRGPLSEAAKENLRIKNLGKKASPSTREKMSVSQSLRWAERKK